MRHREVPEALAALGLPLLTTNYDDLLEEVTGQPAVTWRDSAQVEHVMRGDERGIVHLHGYWRRPDTVVLGIRSYEDVVRDGHAQAMQQATRALKTLLFVGYGGGFDDPNFGALLEWSRKALKSSSYVCYRLALEKDVEELRRKHTADDRVRIVTFGKDFSDLAPFLRSLAPTGRPAGRTVSSSPAPGTPPRPKVLIAGPDFGLPRHLRPELRKAAAIPGARAGFEIQSRPSSPNSSPVSSAWGPRSSASVSTKGLRFLARSPPCACSPRPTPRRSGQTPPRRSAIATSSCCPAWPTTPTSTSGRCCPS